MSEQSTNNTPFLKRISNLEKKIEELGKEKDCSCFKKIEELAKELQDIKKQVVILRKSNKG